MPALRSPGIPTLDAAGPPAGTSPAVHHNTRANTTASPAGLAAVSDDGSVASNLSLRHPTSRNASKNTSPASPALLSPFVVHVSARSSPLHGQPAAHFSAQTLPAGAFRFGGFGTGLQSPAGRARHRRSSPGHLEIRPQSAPIDQALGAAHGTIAAPRCVTGIPMLAPRSGTGNPNNSAANQS